MKRKVVGIVLAVLAILALGRYGCPAPKPAERPLSAGLDSVTALLDTARAALDSALKAIEATKAVQAKTALAFADSLRVVRTRHGAALPPPPPDSAAEALPFWKLRADSLGEWLSACGIEADSAGSAARSYRDAYRQCVQAAGQLTGQLVFAEGRLNQVSAQVGDLEARSASLSRFHLGFTGGAVGGLDTRGPFYGPGVCGGATLSFSLPLLHWRLGTTLGGCGALDLPTTRVRVGAGGSVGLSLRF